MSSQTNNFNFILATRKKLRFEYANGILNIEQLWDLPINHATRPSLTSLAVALNAELMAIPNGADILGIEVGVKDANAGKRADLELSLAIIREVAAIKSAEEVAKREKAAASAENAVVLAELARRKNDALLSKTTAELEAMIKNTEA